jgi:endonuclease
MAPLYDRPVRELMREMVGELGLRTGEVLTRDRVFEWFRSRYPLVKEGTIAAHLLRMSTNAPSRLHHTLRADGSDDLFFQIDARRFRLYDRAQDPTPIAPGAPTGPDDTEKEVDRVIAEASQFAYEHDLRDYLARNLHLIEPGLTLYSEEGVTGVEFPVGGRFVDILAVDRVGNYVVIELKVSKGYDRVVGQLLRYMSWIEKHHANPSEGVRGVIVAKEISEDLRLACARISDVRLFEYSLSVTLRPV